MKKEYQQDQSIHESSILDDLDANFRRNIIQYKIKECYSDVILGLVYSIYDSPKAHMLKA